jgi:outer membrane receptor protein involved in Fe transport
MTFVTKLTENSNLRAVYAHEAVHNDERYLRGITMQPDNFTLNRQDIPLTFIRDAHNFQIDYLHQLPVSWGTFATSVGADGFRNRFEQHQSVHSMPALDTRNPGAYPNDDAYFATPRAGAGLPHQGIEIGDSTMFSYYAQENLTMLKDRVILVGGLRWFHPGGTNENGLTGAVTKRSTKTFRVHKYGIVVKVLPSVSLYFTDAQNVFPAASGRLDKFVAGDGLGGPFKDSEGQMTEFGVKFNHQFSEKVSAYGMLTHYDMAMTNIRTFGTLESGQQGIIQSEQDSADGWELEVGGRLPVGPGFADIYTTYTDGDSAIAADRGKAYVRQAASFVPRKYSILAKYNWTGGPLSGLAVGGGVMDQSAKRDGAHELDFPLTAMAFASYRFRENWQFQLNLDNITDEEYVVMVYADGLVGRSEPFRARATVKYTW